MIINPYSSLLTAYPHLCYNLGTIPTNEIVYASHQSWISQETPLPQASWNFYMIAVWNTAACLHLSIHNPTRLQNLACDIPEANLHLNNIAGHPIVTYLDAKLCSAETAPGLKKFEKLLTNKMQTIECSHISALGEIIALSHHSKSGLTLQITDSKSWTYTHESCHIQEGKTVIA